MNKKHLRPTLHLMVCVTLNCVGLTQYSVTQIIYGNIDRTRFFCLPICSLLSLVFSYSYISQGMVKTHLWCGKIYNNHILQIASERILKIGQ